MNQKATEKSVMTTITGYAPYAENLYYGTKLMISKHVKNAVKRQELKNNEKR